MLGICRFAFNLSNWRKKLWVRTEQKCIRKGELLNANTVNTWSPLFLVATHRVTRTQHKAIKTLIPSCSPRLSVSIFLPSFLWLFHFYFESLSPFHPSIHPLRLKVGPTRVKIRQVVEWSLLPVSRSLFTVWIKLNCSVIDGTVPQIRGQCQSQRESSKREGISAFLLFHYLFFSSSWFTFIMWKHRPNWPQSACRVRVEQCKLKGRPEWVAFSGWRRE